MFADSPLTKDNLDIYLKALAKEFCKRNGKQTPVEIILVGGASILINYGFREMTYDIDAVISSSVSMKEAISAVGDEFQLPVGWLNTDFMKTASYTPKLVQYSKYYKTFSNIVQIRTVNGEYLVAMKLMSGRQYKNDLSDILGILIEQEECGEAYTFEKIKKAVVDLYDKYENLPESSRKFIESVYEKNELKELYRVCREQELQNKDILIEFQKDYPRILNEDNLSNILNAARKKKELKD